MGTFFVKHQQDQWILLYLHFCGFYSRAQVESIVSIDSVSKNRKFREFIPKDLP